MNLKDMTLLDIDNKNTEETKEDMNLFDIDNKNMEITEEMKIEAELIWIAAFYRGSGHGYIFDFKPISYEIVKDIYSYEKNNKFNYGILVTHKNGKQSFAYRRKDEFFDEEFSREKQIKNANNYYYPTRKIPLY